MGVAAHHKMSTQTYGVTVKVGGAGIKTVNDISPARNVRIREP